VQQLGFFAYPGGYPLVRDAIDGAVEASASRALLLKPWEKMKPLGFKLDELIRDQIQDADVLVADITFPNANVFYEMGYAIALGKPVLPTLNTAIEHAARRVQEIGLFDTLGWAGYTNASELSALFDDWTSLSWSSRFVRRRDHGQPLFIFDTSIKPDFRNHIFHAVENSHVKFRSFDPTQGSRLTAAQAVSDVSASAGVIIPLLDTQILGWEVHNLRAAFLAGLSHGYGINPLIIQYNHKPIVPLDYRDFVTNSTFKRETESHVSEYCAKVLIWNQQELSRDIRADLGLLGKINLGSPIAENETGHLSDYFVKTAEYFRALRAEGAIVIGRKGSGKSAVYFQVADAAYNGRATCVVDLRPASHNLSEMREALLAVVAAGVFDHTVAAFWQYILFVEIVLKMREIVLPRSRNDFALQERIRKIESDFGLDEAIVSGDFTSRLERAVKEVVRMTAEIGNPTELRSRLTNMMFELPIPKLRDAVASFQDYFDEVVVLMDDLDKGWPPRRVEPHDIRTVRHLIEVLNKIQRDLLKRNLVLRHLVFLRSDIYERLVEETSDRGKYNVIKVDWSDREQLLHLLRQRIVTGLPPGEHDDAWAAVNAPLASGGSGIDKMIERSLRRPRFLIDLCERTLSFAVNRGHGFVTEADVDEGLRQMSLYLVSDFGYEMRDVAGTPQNIFYAFIGSPELLTEPELEAVLNGVSVDVPVGELIDLLLWYGFLGVVTRSGSAVFIYDRAYDYRRLEAERDANRSERLYALNPAFLEGLEQE
jgi:hypothetical protein